VLTFSEAQVYIFLHDFLIFGWRRNCFYYLNFKEKNMERVLALQSLSEDVSLETGTAESTRSAVCSTESNGTGASSCSIACKDSEEMEW
jgi:hypothetical protein